MAENGSSSITVAVLIVLLLLLIIALVFLYRWLNQNTNGQYTVHELIYGKGGALERLNDGVRAVESRLGVQLRPHKEADTEGEELKEDERRSDVEQGGKEEEEEEEEEETDGQENNAREDSSDDYSSMEGVDLRERVQQTGDKGSEMKEEEKEKEAEEKKEKDELGQGGQGASGGNVLLVDLEPLSGSVIWEDEKKREEKTGDGDLTAL